MSRIMIVDDDENVLKALKRALLIAATPPYEIELFTAPMMALARSHEGDPFDLVISDYRMPLMDGVQFLQKFREAQPEAMRIILSGYADLELLISAINQAQIYRFIEKPWQDHALREDVRHALEFKNLQSENKRLADQVRQQQSIISIQEQELLRLEMETPGITQVRRSADGGILLDEHE